MKITRLLLLLLALATGVFAQENPAKLALAHEVIVAMKADQISGAMAAQLKKMTAQMAMLPATASPEQRKTMEEFQAKSWDLVLETTKGMLGKMDQIYADVYTEPELKAMKAFYTSPEGQSMVAKQPQIMARFLPVMQEMQRDLRPKLDKLMQESKPAKPQPTGQQ